MEEKTDGNSLDEVLDVRQKMTEDNQQLENAIQNDKIPENVRNHLKEVKTRIEGQVTEIKQRVQEAKQLQEAMQNGDESAKQKFVEFKKQRIEEVKRRTEEHQEDFKKFEEKMNDIKSRVEQGDKKAQEILQQIKNTPELNDRMNDFDPNDTEPGAQPFNGEDGEFNNEEQGNQPPPGFFQKFKGFFRPGSDQDSVQTKPTENNSSIEDQNPKPNVKPYNGKNEPQQLKEENQPQPNGENKGQNQQSTPGFFGKVKSFFKQDDEGGDQKQSPENNSSIEDQNSKPSVKPYNGQKEESKNFENKQEKSFENSEKPEKEPPKFKEQFKGFINRTEEIFRRDDKQEPKEQGEPKNFEGFKGNQGNESKNEFKGGQNAGGGEFNEVPKNGGGNQGKAPSGGFGGGGQGGGMSGPNGN